MRFLPISHGTAWVLAAAAILAVGCGFTRPKDYPHGHEIGDNDCHDGLDNDGDGLTDCEDKDCIYDSTWCGEYIPDIPPEYEPEPDMFFVRRYCNPKSKFYSVTKCKSAGRQLLATCHDSIDNDVDGQFDCGQNSCSAIMENCCTKEVDNVTCSDGLDNDGNGFTDCQDFSCRNGMFVDVCNGTTPVKPPENTPTMCSDGVDNDDDGLIDCHDKDCSGQDACKGDGSAEDTLEKCKDGIDNDGNNFTDCGDFSCSKSKNQAVADYCASLAENTLDKCKDGIDNDGNGFTDCGDFSCSQSADTTITDYCKTITETDYASCTDGIDNDNNSFTDCQDHSCYNESNKDKGLPVSPDDKIAKYCEERAENTLAKCSDGKDNDHNGFIDCGDYSCSQSTDKEVFKYCADRMEITFDKCTDGKDNDHNGYTDCQDHSCSKSKDLDVQRACQESAGTLEEAKKACTDGIDNDIDGFVDCDDWDCAHNPILFDANGKNVVCKDRTLVCE